MRKLATVPRYPAQKERKAALSLSRPVCKVEKNQNQRQMEASLFTRRGRGRRVWEGDDWKAESQVP
jgi:hypothetical protein